MRGLGIFLIVLGIIGAIVIIATFDFETYKYYKRWSSTSELELSAMKSDLLNRWVIAISSLLSTIVIGVILMAIEKIINLLKENNEELSLLREKVASNGYKE